MSIARVMLTGMGLGYLRPAPGTWGSTLPVIVVLGLLVLGVRGWQIDAALVLIALIFSIACLRFGEQAEAHFGRKDPSAVVADEVAGQSVALLLLPWRVPVGREDWLWNIALAATAFFAFRFFDIVKPPPARGLQRLRGGAGILVDDLLAGAYALTATQLAAWLFWPRVFTG